MIHFQYINTSVLSAVEAVSRNKVLYLFKIKTAGSFLHETVGFCSGISDTSREVIIQIAMDKKEQNSAC